MIEFQTYPRDGGVQLQLGDFSMWIESETLKEMTPEQFAHALEKLTNNYTNTLDILSGASI